MDKSTSLEDPLVSICIPTFNGEEYIQETLNSIRNQDYGHIELIVSDDQSSDNTLNIIKAFESEADFPVTICKHTPQGIGENWNNCVKQANGHYIKFVFQDDLIGPNCISEMVKAGSIDSNIGLIYCKRKIIDNNEEDFEKWHDRFTDLHLHWDNKSLTTLNQLGKEYLRDANFLIEPLNKIGEPIAVLIKKECFDTIGPFNNELEQVLDFEFFYRLMTKYNVSFIDKELVSFRLHSNQTSVTNSNRNIPDYAILPKIYYEKLFWQLSRRNRMDLLIKFNPVFRLGNRIIMKIKSIFR
jgi:glycosyltransferase involved in cell wall biosynthesis